MRKGERSMIELLVVAVFVVLFVNASILALKLAWGLTKIFACVLMVAAIPLLFVCLVFVGGLALLLPLVLVGGAIGLLWRG